MKGYEKVAIGAAIVGLGLAAYQALHTKKAIDAVKSTDPSRNPMIGAVNLATNVVRGTKDWMAGWYDHVTGTIRGKGKDASNFMSSVPQGVSYWIKEGTDLGKNAVEAGSKYTWNIFSKAQSVGKESKEQITNKAHTLMGAYVSVIDHARYLPTMAGKIADIATGASSKDKESKILTFFSGLKVKLFGR